MRIEYDDNHAGIAPDAYLHLPTVDDTSPSLAHLRQGVDFITEEIARGGTVYVHCASGVGRAPALAAAYLVSTGIGPDEAWERIRAVRPFVRPTPSQVEQVRRFAIARS
jgi:protein-tyrosine phosphatase